MRSVIHVYTTRSMRHGRNAVEPCLKQIVKSGSETPKTQIICRVASQNNTQAAQCEQFLSSSTRRDLQIAEQTGFGLYVKEYLIDGRTCHTLTLASRVWSVDRLGGRME